MEPWQDPAIVRRYEHQQKQTRGGGRRFDTSMLLSHFPWRIKYRRTHEQSTLNNSNEAGLPTAQPTVATHEATSLPTAVDNNDNSSSALLFPTWSYLDIRQQQNIHFANQQLERGVQWAKMMLQQPQPPQQRLHLSSNHKTTDDDDDLYHHYYDNAKQCYDDGLHMHPDYAPLWVALGALEANAGHWSQAEVHLQHALTLDANTPNAKEYLYTIQQQQQQQQKQQQQQTRKVKKSAWVERSETARQNVVLEQTMMMMIEPEEEQRERNDRSKTTTTTTTTTASPLPERLDATDEAHYHDDQEKRRVRSNHDDDDDESDEERRHRRRRRRHRDDERRKTYKQHKSDGDDDDDDDDSGKRRRRRRRRRHEERRHSHHHHHHRNKKLRRKCSLSNSEYASEYNTRSVVKPDDKSELS